MPQSANATYKNHVLVHRAERVSHFGAEDGLLRGMSFMDLCMVAPESFMVAHGPKGSEVEFKITERALKAIEQSNCDTCIIRLATMAANGLVVSTADLKRLLELLDE